MRKFKPGAFALSLANVREREALPLMYMLLHAFLNGLGISLAFTAINILIINEHGVGILPRLYIIASILLLIAGLVYSRAEHIQPPEKLFKASVLICVVWALIMAFSLGVTSSLILVGLAFSTYYVVYLLSNLEFWGVAAIYFDIRQGKRLFGPLAIGESIAKIIGYSLTALVVQ